LELDFADEGIAHFLHALQGGREVEITIMAGLFAKRDMEV
jgi:hypothetical protein